MVESTVFGSNFAGPNSALSQQERPPQDSSSSMLPYRPHQQQQQPPSDSGASSMTSDNYYPPSTSGHHVPGGLYDPRTGRYYASTTLGNKVGITSFPNAGGGGSGSDGNSIHVLVEDGDDDGDGVGSGGPSAWTILTFVLLILASFFIGFLVNYGLRRARKRRKRVIITDDPTALNASTIVPPGAVSLTPSVANADMDIESMGGGRYPLAYQSKRPRGRRDSIGAGSIYSAPVQYVFDDDSSDDDDIEVVSTSGRKYFSTGYSDPPAHLYPSSKSPRFPHRTSISSAASKALHNSSIGSYLSSSYKGSSFRTRSSTTRDDYDQSSVDTSIRANSTRRARRNSL